MARITKEVELEYLYTAKLAILKDKASGAGAKDRIRSYSIAGRTFTYSNPAERESALRELSARINVLEGNCWSLGRVAAI